MSKEQPTLPAETPTPAQSAVTLYRARLTYARREALRYVSHLDMQLVWERTLRRAGIALAFSQGFNPRPRLHLASALPLGFLSACELTDFWLSQPEGAPAPDVSALVARVQAAAPPGLEILSGEFVPLNLPALQTQVQAAEYVATPLDALDPAPLVRAAADLLAAETLPRERRGKPGAPGKPYDLRPLIEGLEVQAGELLSRPRLFMRLAAREGATGRPEELLAALGYESASWRVERIRLVL